tara:strand:+ start:122 stop:244 length:123 start_codon:yes stop_codon:yes gene_type:complete
MTSTQRKIIQARNQLIRHLIMGACMGFVISAALFLPLVLQ